MNADHYFEGSFDEHGQFTGTVNIYRQNPENYNVPWDGAKGQTTRCGQFRVKIAYLQGNQRDSLLPVEEHSRIMTKLNRFGGLYVYRDGVRVTAVWEF